MDDRHTSALQSSTVSRQSLAGTLLAAAAVTLATFGAVLAVTVTGVAAAFTAGAVTAGVAMARRPAGRSLEAPGLPTLAGDH